MGKELVKIVGNNVIVTNSGTTYTIPKNGRNPNLENIKVEGNRQLFNFNLLEIYERARNLPKNIEHKYYYNNKGEFCISKLNSK